MNKAIGKKEFANEVAGSTTLSLVHFKTEWNGASQIVSMMYEELANAYRGVVNFFTVDMETETVLAKEFGVSEIPAILFFKNGQVIDHAKGLIPKNALICKIEIALISAKS